MVFSSIDFIFKFIPVFFLLFYIFKGRARTVILLIGSLVFYAVGEPVYIFLIIISILINYLLGLLIAKAAGRGTRKFLLILTLLIDFGALAVFKYADFILTGVNNLFGFISDNTSFSLPVFTLPSLALPLGISFYTFQIVSYVVDVYKGTEKQEKNIINLATYICMFPQLIAGPIINYGEVRDEIVKPRINAECLEDGLKTFALGLGSKVLLANRISCLFEETKVAGFDSISTPLAWLGALSYSFQIFFDFYGYSLMAIGLGRMMGITIPDNFNFPYISKTMTEFWRRWHITLGKWFRTYVYIPLGGNRKGRIRTFINILIVWGLTGLWHGAGMNFVIWGLAFAILLIIEKLFLGKVLNKVPLLGHLYVIILMPVTWIIFAISDMDSMLLYLSRMFPTNGNFGGLDPLDYIRALVTYGPLFIVCIIFATPLPMRLYKRFKNNPITLVLLLLIFWGSIYMLAVGENNPFLYFRF